MYAITFDLDIESLKNSYHNDSHGNAYKEIKNILVDEYGFEWRQGSVYFGLDDSIDAVTCVLATQELAQRLHWFEASVRDIRMLKIEENNDLKPAMNSKSKKKANLKVA